MNLEFDESFDLGGFEHTIYADKRETPDQSVIDRLRFDDAMEIPWQITDLDLWKNYTDDDLYELDKKLREYFAKCRVQRERKKGQKTAVPLVFAWMFGRKPRAEDSQICVTLHKLMKYYSTRWTGRNLINGVQFTRVYYFSPYATRNKRPYSLRLRLELEHEKGGDINRGFRTYGTNKQKGPKWEKSGLGDRGHGPGADVGSCAYKRGQKSVSGVSGIRGESSELSGSEDVHGCDIQQ